MPVVRVVGALGLNRMFNHEVRNRACSHGLGIGAPCLCRLCAEFIQLDIQNVVVNMSKNMVTNKARKRLARERLSHIKALRQLGARDAIAEVNAGELSYCDLLAIAEGTIGPSVPCLLESQYAHYSDGFKMQCLELLDELAKAA